MADRADEAVPPPMLGLEAAFVLGFDLGLHRSSSSGSRHL